MLVLQDIMKVLKVNEEVARKVRDVMEDGYFDFSECTQREFNKAAKEAYKEI